MCYELYTLQTASKENHYFTAKQDDHYSFTTMKMSGVKVKVRCVTVFHDMAFLI